MEQSSYTKYEYVKQDLLRRIETGEFSVTKRVPSENELCKSYSVSVMTARKALNDLVSEGKIQRIKGKGSFLVDETEIVGTKDTSLCGHGIISLVLNSYEKSDSSIMTIIQGVQNTLTQYGYSMTIECSNRDAKTEAQILERCVRDKVKGVLIFSTSPEVNLPYFVALEKAGIPFVMLDREIKGYPCTMVSSYNFDGMYQAVQHLIELGHVKIAYLASETSTSVHEDRLAGYQMALKHNGIQFDENICYTENYSQLHLLPDLIGDNGVTAIVCINDHLALEAVDYLGKRGLNVPDDVSVIGFDDTTMSGFAGLTTVRQQFCEIGETSVEKLLKLVHKKNGHSHTLLPMKLIVRDTTGPVKKK